MSGELVEPLFVDLGGDRRWPVATVADASALFCAASDKFGAGASQTPTALIRNERDGVVAHISYNGRVWAGAPEYWQKNAVPLFEPSATKSQGGVA